MAKTNESDREAAARLTADRPFPELAGALRSQANQIVAAWTGAIRAAIPAATNLPSPELQEHLPAILAKMANALDRVAGQDTDRLTQPSPAPEPTPVHQRYDVRALMTEDRLLRRVIIERVRTALGRQMIKTERVAIDKGIDTMLREAVMAQHGWVSRPTSSSKHQDVVMPTSTPVAPTQNPALTSGPVIGTGVNSLSPEKPTTTNSPMPPGSFTGKAAVPVFVELPPQPQVFPVAPAPTAAAQVATPPGQSHVHFVAPASPAGMRLRVENSQPASGKQSGNLHRKAPHVQSVAHATQPAAPPAAELMRAPQDWSADTASEAAIAPPVEITHESVSVAAYYIWEKKGRQEGRALEDWLHAESELWEKKSAS